jgi:hypothetical protein
MIRYITRKEINDTKWNALIVHAPNGLPYAFSSYLDIVADKKWNALIQGDYEAVMPLPWRRKAGINYIYPPFFTQQLGIFSKNNLSEKTIDEFIHAIPEKFRFVEMSMNIENNFENKNFKSKRRVTHHLLLNKTYESIAENYKENTKRNLKKAQQFNLKIDDRISADKLIELFQQEKSNEVKELKSRDYKRLKELIDHFTKNTFGEIYGVKNENGKYCAGGFFLRDSPIIINLFPISNDEGRKNGAMFLLIDFIIKRHAGSDCKLDFEGSEIEGIARFYKGFGGKEKLFPQLKINRLPKALKWVKK